MSQKLNRYIGRYIIIMINRSNLNKIITLPINIDSSIPSYSIFNVFDENITLWLNSICFNNAAAAETA